MTKSKQSQKCFSPSALLPRHPPDALHQPALLPSNRLPESCRPFSSFPRIPLLRTIAMALAAAEDVTTPTPLSAPRDGDPAKPDSAGAKSVEVGFGRIGSTAAESLADGCASLHRLRRYPRTTSSSSSPRSSSPCQFHLPLFSFNRTAQGPRSLAARCISGSSPQWIRQSSRLPFRVSSRILEEEMKIRRRILGLERRIS